MRAQDLAFCTACELIELYRSKQVSPVEATRACLDRIARHDPALNAFCLVDEAAALAAARESEARWMRGTPLPFLDGLPVSIKDLILTRGWPTLRGSTLIARDQPWADDAPVTARLREHGAVLLGKTTTPEMGWKGVTDSALTGITRNPWNPAKTPGGSSGGAAVALATGMCALAIGTDGGGSIRIPASFTGVFGLKPNFGRVAAWPLSPFGTVAHVGPMTRSVADAALMMNAIAQPDARDGFNLPHDPRDYLDGLDDGIAGLRIAYSPALGHARVHPEVAQAVQEAVRAFADLGARVTETDLDLSEAEWIFHMHWWAGAFNLARSFSAEQIRRLDPGLQRVIDEARATITLADYFKAVEARGAFGIKMNRFFADFDLLVTPQLAVPAFEVGRLDPDGDTAAGGAAWTRWTPFTYPFNLTGQPACSVPCGFTRHGLPIGLQIVGPQYGERLVLRAARAFERARPWRDSYRRLEK
ncbi:MAG TPA: amidase [Burkholderiales bacterium]|nr:amidase [Burkholderiales bacterium]